MRSGHSQKSLYELPPYIGISVFRFVSLLICCWEDWYVVVDVGLLRRSEALADPDVTDLLPLRFDVGVKDSRVELLQKRQRVLSPVNKVIAAKKLSQMQVVWSNFADPTLRVQVKIYVNIPESGWNHVLLIRRVLSYLFNLPSTLKIEKCDHQIEFVLF